MNNEKLEKKTGMSFRAAWFQMLLGRKVKRPTWGGYWAFENGTVMMHTLEGDVVDIRDTANVPYTMDSIVAHDWLVVEEAQHPDKPEEKAPGKISVIICGANVSEGGLTPEQDERIKHFMAVIRRQEQMKQQAQRHEN